MSDSQFERESTGAPGRGDDFAESYRSWRIYINNEVDVINKRVKFIKWQIQAISFAWLMATAAFGMCAYMMWCKW